MPLETPCRPQSQCLIASYRGDFEWLQYCLRSLHRFSDGFLPPVVAVSFDDLDGCRELIAKEFPAASAFVFDLPPNSSARIYDDRLRPTGELQPGAGMHRAMGAMLHADLLCPEADNIFLVGSDCLATDEFVPDKYLDPQGRPVVLYHSYAKLQTVHRDACGWQAGTAHVLGFVPENEYMRRLPSVFDRENFSSLREYIERLHGKPFLQYWWDSFAAGQCGQSEANLLGACAHRLDPDSCCFLSLDDMPAAVHANYPNVLLQFWSHGGLDKPIVTHFMLPSGDVFGRRPRDVIAEVLPE